MEFGPELLELARIYTEQGLEIARGWLFSPAAWSQFGVLLAAFLIALFLSRRIRPWLARNLAPPEEREGPLDKIRRFLLALLPLMTPLLAYGLTGLGENVTREIFGSGAVIAFGQRVFLFLAARIFVREIIQDPMIKLLGRYVLIPVAALYVVGLLEPAMTKLDETVIPLGNLSFSVLFALRFLVVAGVIFWLGRWSNEQSAQFLKGQQEMRPAMRELTAKAVEIAIFGVAFLLVMNIMGINLTSLAVLGGAIGVGLGFGLQKIASNFISGLILLLEGQATVGDYVELDGGEAGTIVKMTARAAILETFDGRWIVVPNEDFITTRVVNYSDSGSANRYEAPFSVSYDTDINTVPAIIEAAVSSHPRVLDAPYPPDCELRGFGDSGVDFAVEFWVEGLDDGPNKFTSDILFLIWNALKDNGIEIPYPHRKVELTGTLDTRPG
ncbi:Mechanosensitive ion channel [Cribrihabitans marinus]|uniref:Mechanosensitive ion channel n=1 Tax=Cribrihabitans marinus TaxID=1227549 RepID=A0A1H6XK35_9RHOB|nr:mechanosensitive ion channel domain-containing protein [Cribrihabitans marinus]GGH27573.1 hypothetical protein GCM10010973_15940 [Cribrihabitans marinus]SEJ29443.1 Mechanosensitive ion channel [Cribrihabitans marinus]